MISLASAGEHSSPAVTPSVSVVAVGHIVMATAYPPGAPSLPPRQGHTLFAGVKDTLGAADVAFGNLAAPISDRGSTRKRADGVNVFAFRTPSSFAPRLREAGFDVLNAANNHILDFGPEAYQDTLSQLDRLGIGHVGRKGEVWKTTVNGIRVSFLGFTQPYRDFFESHHNIPAAAAIVRRAAADTDVLVVGFHGGTEGAGSLHTPRGPERLGSEYRGEVVKLARALVDAGAHLVVGFGPHLPRAMEFHRHRLIAYSLGNFATYGPFNLKGAGGLSLILEARFDVTGALVAARIHPLKVEKPGIPKPDPVGATLAHLRALSREDFPESYPCIAGNGIVSERDRGADARCP